MSRYSETIGSFIRTGNYPLEANYIFNSELELKNFYSEDINHTLLHKGLLKIVSTEDLQILYWVVSIDGELQFKPLISANSLEELFNRITELRNSLDQEIVNREQAIIDVLGTSNKENFLNGLDNLLAVSNAVIELQELVLDHSNEIKAIVGTEEENIILYLRSLDYNNLTEISNLLYKFFDTIDESDTKINTLPELQEFLKGFDYTENLQYHLNQLVDNIYGTPKPNTEFRTLRGIQDFIQELAVTCYHRDRNLQTELDQTQIGVGLNSDGLYSADLETIHLKNATSVMNALKTLDSLIISLKAKNTNSINLNIEKDTSNKHTLSANVKLSSEEGNLIIINSDGLYHNSNISYSEGVLTHSVNGQVISTYNLGLNAETIVERAYYDTTSENIIIIFKTQDQESLQVEIPASDLITEWLTVNNPNSVIELTRERVINGPDNLSADIRLDSNSQNLLTKNGNKLLVDGSNLAKSSEIQTLRDSIPTKTSLLTNDSGFITSVLNLDDYYTKTESDNKFLPKGDYLTEHQDISGLATKQELSDSTSGLATTLELNNAVSGINTLLENYALKSEIPTKTSQLSNDSGYINDISNLATKTEVNSINTDVLNLTSLIDDIVTTGGEPNTINTIKVNNITQPITDKTVNLTIPANVTDLADYDNYLTKDSLDWYEG